MSHAMPFCARIATGAVLLSSLAMMSPVLAATPAATAALPLAPPPGLYRIDFDGTFNPNGGSGTVQQRTDGASGDVSTRISMGGASADRQFKGAAPVNHCVQAMPAGGLPALPPAMAAAAAACSTQSTTPTADGYVHVAVCPGSRSTLTVRRLDDKTWEMQSETSVTQPTGDGAMDALRPMLEMMAKSGTPEQQAGARKQLAALPQMQAQTSAQRAQALDNMTKAQAKAKSPEEAVAIGKAMQAMQQGTGQMHGSSRQRWTRIADSCGTAAPPR